MKRWKINWKKACVVAFCAAMLILVVRMYQKMDALTNQLTYMQDSTSVILSDMGNLQSNIEKTLQEEASMVEDYSITVRSLDFANKKYTVDVSVVPKEYTDKTEVSIFFGTLETTLKRGKYEFTGSVDLPLDNDFEDNITFLLSNGRKKTTEVLNDYQGLDLNLDHVLMAKLDKAPTVKGTEIRLDSTCAIELTGSSRFTFQSLDLVTMLDDKQIDREDLLAQISSGGTGESGSGSGDNSVDVTEASADDATEEDTTEGVSGSIDCVFAYKLPEEDTEDSQTQEDTPEKQRLRICVRAKTTDGYRFEYTVFEGDYLTEDKTLDKDSFQWNTKNVAYDRNGNELELDVHELTEE